MATSDYSRLSALDANFLALESDNVHMHVGALVTFDAGPLTGSDGGLDFDAVRGEVERSLSATPRFRQKLDTIPLFEHPVWVDDERFNLDYHVRHTALPAPGDDRRLKRLAGRILSQKLDRGKPLWEVWVVEGVDAGRFALVAKAHHCMVDGVAGLDLLTNMLRLEPGTDSDAEPVRWSPRPSVSSSRLFTDELVRRASAPLAALRQSRKLVESPQEVASEVVATVKGVGEILRAGLSGSAATPLNEQVGPFRRFDWATTELTEISEVRKRFGGTINDVALATAAGAIGEYLADHGRPVDDESFRVQVPMNVRADGHEGDGGNQIALLIAPLPVGVRDPVQRLKRTQEITAEVKQSGQRAGLETVSELSDRVFPELVNLISRLAVRQRSFNVVITNVPGPRFPVYLLDSPLLDIYPLVPLAANQSLGIALFSYNGKLEWGLHADWDSMPDIHDLAEGIDRHFAELLDRARTD